MEALYNYNIKIVEGNPFALLVPFVKRTFVSCKPIDEDIDVMALEDVVAKFGGVEYPAEKTPGGVLVRIPGTLKPENYDLIVTAKYYGTDIRAAYKAVTIVSWNEQSNVQQYVQGSPVVLPAAFYIASLTDAELEQLKQDLRDAAAAAEQAKADAEQAKAEWEQKAAELEDVAKETTSQEIKQLIIDEGIINAHEYAQEINEIIGDWGNE